VRKVNLSNSLFLPGLGKGNIPSALSISVCSHLDTNYEWADLR